MTKPTKATTKRETNQAVDERRNESLRVDANTSCCRGMSAPSFKMPSFFSDGPLTTAGRPARCPARQRPRASGVPPAVHRPTPGLRQAGSTRGPFRPAVVRPAAMFQPIGYPCASWKNPPPPPRAGLGLLHFGEEALRLPRVGGVRQAVVRVGAGVRLRTRHAQVRRPLKDQRPTRLGRLAGKQRVVKNCPVKRITTAAIGVIESCGKTAGTLIHYSDEFNTNLTT